MTRRGTIWAVAMLAAAGADLCAAAQVVTEGLVAAYEFNGNADDSSGNGNHGQVFGATLTVGRFGNADSAYAFDGASNDHIAVADSASLDQTTYSAVSVAGLVSFGDFVATSSTNGQTVLGKWGLQPVAYVLYRGSDKRLVWNVNNDPATIAIGPAPVRDDTWYHVVGTADQDRVKLYVNGSLVASSQHGLSGMNSSLNGLRIGYEESGPSPFSGVMDDVYVYKRALTDAEVGMLYAEAIPEPEAYALLPVGLAVVGFIVRRRARSGIVQPDAAK